MTPSIGQKSFNKTITEIYVRIYLYNFNHIEEHYVILHISNWTSFLRYTSNNFMSVVLIFVPFQCYNRHETGHPLQLYLKYYDNRVNY